MSKSQAQKKPRNFGKFKKSFDSVTTHYRALSGIGSISAVNLEKAGGAGTPNLAKPTPLDFRCDVEKCVTKIVKKKLVMFYRVYLKEEYEPLEQERLADKCLGGVRHSYEQRLGEEFCKRRIYPVQGKGGYFHTIKNRRKKDVQKD
jgi:hypothetical protein